MRVISASKYIDIPYEECVLEVEIHSYHGTVDYSIEATNVGTGTKYFMCGFKTSEEAKYMLSQISDAYIDGAKVVYL